MSFINNNGQDHQDHQEHQNLQGPNPSSCKLCHGRMNVATQPDSAMMAVSGTVMGVGSTPSTQNNCHANCILFACPGCVAKNRADYEIIDMTNHVFDFQCGKCMADIPPSRRGSVESDIDIAPVDPRQLLF